MAYLGTPDASATWTEDKGWKETLQATFSCWNSASVPLRLLDTTWGWAATGTGQASSWREACTGRRWLHVSKTVPTSSLGLLSPTVIAVFGPSMSW